MSVQIRVAKPEDAAQLLRIYRYYVEETAVSFEYITPSVEEFARRIANTLSRYPYLVAEENGVLLGYAYAHTFIPRAAYDRCCEMTIYLDKDRRRQGLGRRLYTALEETLTRMGILNLYACIADPEAGDPYVTRDSINFHTRMGYTLAGTFTKSGYKFGCWYDMVWMEKLLGEHGENPQPVRAFPEL